MSSEENGKKAAAGGDARKAMRRAVENLAHDGAVVHFEESPRFGYEGYDQKQFAAHERIRFCDGTEAILFATSSLSSDRVRSHQWSASNIKQIDPSVEYAFLILPDSEKVESRSSGPIDEIREQRVVSALDDVLTLSEFYQLGLAKYSSSLGYGKDHDYQGRAFEDVVAETMNNKSNLKRFNGDSSCVGYFFDTFRIIFSCLGIKKNEVTRVKATTDIPLLPSGGNPKTDVAVTVFFLDGHTNTFTFSLKNTSRKAVSVHEYSANDFCDVLDPNNTELRHLLNSFQAAGSMKAMTDDDRHLLSRALMPYHLRLDRWVLGGYGAEGVTPLQCAEYLLVHDKQTGDISVHALDSYIRILEKDSSREAGFGTAFSWTYPSGKRGKRIQLKCKICL